jgi:phospholipase C
MPPDLSKINNVVIVMLENRSFDHMLGYLSLPPFNRSEVDGLRSDRKWLKKFSNVDGGQSYQPFRATECHSLPKKFDPPHERVDIAAHLGELRKGQYSLNGFVSRIPEAVSKDPAARSLVMSYFGAEEVPLNDFLARNFAICDRWFSSLPAGTQPNRLMAMSGYSMIESNCRILPDHELVYDWLSKHNVTWRVYHQGLPFFTLMPRWIPQILGSDHFKDFRELEEDLQNTPPDELPQVIFVEPTYEDSPHMGFSTDAHAPAGISNGQEFLMQVYNAVTGSRVFWKGAAMIVGYDEHGGFFDHVSPPAVITNPPKAGGYPPFASLGVRTPAHVISPFVKKGSVNHTLLDHISVLKFLGDRFAGGSYSEVVDARPVGSLSTVFNFEDAITDPPAAPALIEYLTARPPKPEGATVPECDTVAQLGFQDALETLRKEADNDHPKFGELLAATDEA